MVHPPYFQTQDYRKVIEIAFNQKSKEQKKTYAAAAVYCQVQPTYFSNVLKGRADFSEDQIFSLCYYLTLTEIEADYLKLVHQWERSGLKERKALLQEQINSLREKALSPAQRFRAPKVEKVQTTEELLFFLDPMHQILMLSLGINPEVKASAKVREALGLSQERFDGLVENLLTQGRLKIEKSKFEKTNINYHLGSDSKILFQHQSSLRQMSLEKMRQLSRKDFKAFSATFGVSAKEKAAISEILTETLEKVREITEKSKHKADGVYQINLDFFPWFTNQ